jgi:hypothetical protein
MHQFQLEYRSGKDTKHAATSSQSEPALSEVLASRLDPGTIALFKDNKPRALCRYRDHRAVLRASVAQFLDKALCNAHGWLTTRWVSCKALFQRATPTATTPGVGDRARSNPMRALFVLVRQPPKGRRAKTATGRRARPRKSEQSARTAREPWLLVASVRFAELAPKQLVRRYRQRMQIEERFCDLKSQHFGEGLERSRSEGSGRFTVLVLIATLAAFLLWLLGTAAEHSGLPPLAAPRQWQAPGLLAAVPRAPAVGLGELQGALGRLDSRVGAARSMGLERSRCAAGGLSRGGGFVGVLQGTSPISRPLFPASFTAPKISSSSDTGWPARPWRPSGIRMGPGERCPVGQAIVTCGDR